MARRSRRRNREPVAETGPPLPKDVDRTKLSPAELSRYLATVHNHETKVTATVELAGSARNIKLNEINLLEETGVAFGFPVKVKLSNPFLGNSCYVGSDTSPIVVDFTTGTAGELRGKAGNLTSNKNGSILTVVSDTLVSNSFAAPGVEGCGVEGGADEALDSALGLPAPAGHNVAILNGAFKQVGAETAEEGLAGNI